VFNGDNLDLMLFKYARLKRQIGGQCECKMGIKSNTNILVSHRATVDIREYVHENIKISVIGSGCNFNIRLIQ